MGVWGGGYAAATASIIGDEISASGQRATNAAMIAEQNKIMDWETMMSDTAMTRRVEDLKGAGLNPALAVGEGGASTPGMSAVQLGNPGASFGQLGQQIAGAASSAQQVRETDQAQQLLPSQIKKNEADARLSGVNADKAAGVDSTLVEEQTRTQQSMQRVNDSQVQLNQSWEALNGMQQQVAGETVAKIKAEIPNIFSQTNLNDSLATLNHWNSLSSQLDDIEKTYAMRATVQDIVNRAQASGLAMDQLKAISDFYRSNPGAPNAEFTMKVIQTSLEVLGAGALVLKGGFGGKK